MTLPIPLLTDTETPNRRFKRAYDIDEHNVVKFRTWIAGRPPLEEKAVRSRWLDGLMNVASDKTSSGEGLTGFKSHGGGLDMFGEASRTSQSSATMERARSSLSLASLSLCRCSSVRPAWSIWSVSSLKTLYISVKYTTCREEGVGVGGGSLFRCDVKVQWACVSTKN